ncbi:MAG: RagB/SusD family nutrient uptake outer membrane protein, partial [Cyanobacteria bacterium WB6_1B_304]|nr:RagB/SusD family nutrient uptake outer membrane protein [Cyanobacteria bacterium WB6_1B_304]
TMPSQDIIATIKANYSAMWATHYSKYPTPQTLAIIQSFVTTDKLLLPIPQREIDNNTKIQIPQNPGY